MLLRGRVLQVNESAVTLMMKMTEVYKFHFAQEATITLVLAKNRYFNITHCSVLISERLSLNSVWMNFRSIAIYIFFTDFIAILRNRNVVPFFSIITECYVRTKFMFYLLFFSLLESVDVIQAPDTVKRRNFPSGLR
mmetsp:Transcript_41342/g.107056  ORF Transcript_41342/g.107056 Transcript_41342/m.107056 type:complete len:137 (+) Transcript_41342:3239-3649(+)